MTPAEYRLARRQYGTQSAAATALGVARSTIARRESGRIAITREAALAIRALTAIREGK